MAERRSCRLPNALSLLGHFASERVKEIVPLHLRRCAHAQASKYLDLMGTGAWTRCSIGRGMLRGRRWSRDAMAKQKQIPRCARD